MWTNKTALLFLFTTFATGLCGSFFFPLSSLFMVEALNATPAMLSAFLVLSVFSSVVVSQCIAYHSDRGWKRKTILLCSFCSYLVTVLGFSYIHDYYLAVAISIVFGSAAGAIYGQAFALAREYADRHLNESAATFLSTLRAGMALAWVFGPPIAFIIKAEYGFSATFLLSASMIALTIVIVFLFLPDSEMKVEAVEETPEVVPWYQRTSIVLFCLSMLMIFFANGLYLTAMPLYVTKELGLNESLPGMFYGTAALFEIPIMLVAGSLAVKYGGQRMVGVALICGMVFFTGIIYATEIWQLIAIQLFNGVFIGINATLGMVILQDMMKDQIGVASTLFSNVLQGSTLLASLSIGIVGGLYDYHATFYLCVFGTVLGLIFLLMIGIRNRSSRKIDPVY